VCVLKNDKRQAVFSFISCLGLCLPKTLMIILGGVFV
jgi:hypothetical protein